MRNVSEGRVQKSKKDLVSDSKLWRHQNKSSLENIYF